MYFDKNNLTTFFRKILKIELMLKVLKILIYNSKLGKPERRRLNSCQIVPIVRFLTVQNLL